MQDPLENQKCPSLEGHSYFNLMSLRLQRTPTSILGCITQFRFDADELIVFCIRSKKDGFDPSFVFNREIHRSIYRCHM
jgi:hypothetical protein